MKNGTYHQGNLKNELIEKGIELISEEGYDSFSIRKVSKRIGVSANACYNHYEDKEALIKEMKEYVNDKFAKKLEESYDLQDEFPMVNMGIAYFCITSKIFSFYI